MAAYASFVAAQSLELSGLLALFFSGVFVRHYHMYNVSHASAVAITQILSTAAFLAENFIYLYLGASLLACAFTGGSILTTTRRADWLVYRCVDADSFRWDWPFIAASLAVTVLARAANTFPLCFMANLWRSEAIPFKYMLVIWFSGLRGSIAFALALNVRLPTGREDAAAVIRASTLATVIATTVVRGSA